MGNRASVGGLSANKQLQTEDNDAQLRSTNRGRPKIDHRSQLHTEPVQQQAKQEALRGLSARSQLTTDNSDFLLTTNCIMPTISHRQALSTEPVGPSMMQQPAFSGLSARNALTTDPFVMNANVNINNMQPMQQAASFGLSARKPLATNDNMQQMMQQTLSAGLSARKPLATNSNKPIAKEQRAREAGLSARKPLAVNNFNNDDDDFGGPQLYDSYDQDVFNSNIDDFIVDAVITNSNNEFVLGSSTSSLLASAVSGVNIELLKIPPPPIPRLSNYQIATNVVDVASALSEGVQYAAQQSLLSTSEIEKELQGLENIYQGGFIQEPEYQKRKAVLLAMKPKSKDVFIPVVNYNSAVSSINAQAAQAQHQGGSTNRNVRVFISSTFRDMTEEREVLLKTVFPELQKLCKQRGVFLTTVDLRWGITTEQTTEGNTINICLSQIDKCRPYFICLLGKRYGWAQPTKEGPQDQGDETVVETDQLLKKTFDKASANFPWLQQYRDKSVTELEVRHAVLNDTASDTAARALFYLKKAAGVPDDDKRLTQLKDELASNSSLKVNNYSKAVELGARVLADFKALLDKDFPLSSIPGPLEQERTAHLAFQESRSRVYIGRKHYFDTLHEHVGKSNAGPIIVVAESGLGKSALMCNWVVQHQEKYKSRLVIAHYIGSTPASSELGKMLHRIMAEINDAFKLEKEIPQEVSKLVEKFPEWLQEVHARGGCTIVLDAVNQLDAKDDAHSFRWLPHQIPSSVTLLVSSTPGKCWDVLRQRKWVTMQVEPLTTDERRSMVQEYMAMYAKRLSEAQLHKIVSSAACNNPLYLRTLLEELRVFGSFEQLDAKIEYYLQARLPPDLFQLVFQRLEDDFPTKGTPLVERVLALIWVARRGLTEVELLEMLNITQAEWSPLHLALDEALVSRSGYFTFFHDYMRQAVETRYLKKSSTALQHYRTTILQHFSSAKNVDENRQFEEVPYQLEQSERWSELSDFISKPQNFASLFSGPNKYDLFRYWRACQARSLDPATQLLGGFSAIANNASANDVKMALQAAKFFEETGAYQNAEMLYRETLKIAETQKNSKDISIRLEALAYLLRLKGRYAEALPLYERALKLREEFTKENDQQLAQLTNSLAVLLRLMGKYDQAEPLYNKALHIRKALFGEVHEDIAQSYNSLGCLNQDMGRYKEAETFFHQAIHQRETLLGTIHPDVAMSLYNLGGLYLDWSKYDEAKPIYTKALSIYEAIFGQNHPSYAQVLNSLAGLNQEMGKFAEAEQLYAKTLQIKQALLGEVHPEIALTLNDFAVLYARQDKHEQAEALYLRALNIRKTVLGETHPDYAQSLKNLGSVYQDTQQYDKALPLYTQCLQILENVFGAKHMDVASALHHLAAIHQLKGEFNQAIPLYNRALAIYKEMLGDTHADVALTLNDLAILYFKQGNHKTAEEYYLQSLKTYQAVFGEVHPDVAQSLLNTAQFYKAKGDLKKATGYYEQSISVFNQTLGPQNSRTKAAVASYNAMLGK